MQVRTLLTPVDPHALKAMLGDGDELALVDLREELIFSQGHLLFARSVPLSRLELTFAQLVPRRGTRIVLCDDGGGLVERAAEILLRAGYTDLRALAGGVSGWADAGLELFSGVNVPSKAFGEYIEHACATPSIAADELDRLIRDGTDMVVLDSRPFDEYQRVSIPTAINVPGAELVLRVRDIAPSPDTLVVVNCAGRTRSIIGAQSLINAGVPNRVVALRNGTMGWSLAGFTCDSSKAERAPGVSSDGVAFAKSASRRVAERFGVRCIDRTTLDRWRGESDARTLYIFDVRDPSEYEVGHVAGALSAPGGQLVQATDQYIGTLGSRIVLTDDKEVRAVMTASWLRQMGWADVHVLAEAGEEKGRPSPTVLGTASGELAITCADLTQLMARDATTVIDLSLSRNYLKAHIAGAWFAIRAHLAQSLSKASPSGTLILTSEDGVLAGVAAEQVQQLTDRPVRYLDGGNAAWQAAGHALTAADPKMADEPLDAWLKPYERTGNAARAMNDYLSWEVDLLTRIARDGTTNFAVTPQRS
jgi:rhodanese-related sulfurtransferase